MKKAELITEPLEISTHDDNGQIVIREQYCGRIVANLECDRYDNFTDEEIKANAALFAASREMYNALKIAREYRLQAHHGDDKCLAIINAALSKANPQ